MIVSKPDNWLYISFTRGAQIKTLSIKIKLEVLFGMR